jgi:hypothetical protein
MGRRLMDNDNNIVIDIDDIPDPLDMALNKNRITADFLARKLCAELESTKIIFLKKTDRAKGEYIEVIDWPTRQRARMDAQRIRGDYPAQKAEINFQNNDAELPPEIQQMIKSITERRI